MQEVLCRSSTNTLKKAVQVVNVTHLGSHVFVQHQLGEMNNKTERGECFFTYYVIRKALQTHEQGGEN